MDDKQDNQQEIKEALAKEAKIKKGLIIFMACLGGGFLGALFPLIWAIFFYEADSFTEKMAGIEMALFYGALIGGFIGGVFYKAFSIVTAALAWLFGMDLDF